MIDAMKERQDIYQTMTAARLEAGLTQSELARLMRTTQSVIARLENGRSLPSGSSVDPQRKLNPAEKCSCQYAVLAATPEHTRAFF
jgi:predicted transcriptional regulator